MSVQDIAEGLRLPDRPTRADRGSTDIGRLVPPPHIPAWNWEALAEGTPHWRAAWEDLGRWVQWYTDRYELWQSLPVCWYLHGRLVEELRALRFHHDEVFAAKATRGDPEHRSHPPKASAGAYRAWMTTPRARDRAVLGRDARHHGACSGLRHASLPPRTVEGRADWLRRMGRGLTAMLDDTVAGPRCQ